ncbi:MAG: hypothetical protein MHM6MM_002975 [Cercozoa sp. M6MM]
MSLVFRNGHRVRLSKELKDALVAIPDAAYTTCRTVGEWRVFHWNQHVNRLYVSAQKCFEYTGDFESFAERTKQETRAILRVFHRQYPNEDARVTLAVVRDSSLQAFIRNDGESESASSRDDDLTWLLGASCLSASALHKQELHSAAIMPGHRPRGQVKSSSWMRQRAVLERVKPEDCDEVWLKRDDQAVTEGLSSNVFVFCQAREEQDGTLVVPVLTANTLDDGDGVLSGTLRSLTMSVLTDANLQLAGRTVRAEIRETAPNLANRSDWRAGLTTSTTRRAREVHELRLFDAPDSSDPEILRFDAETPEFKLMQHVSQRTQELMSYASEDLSPK